MSDLVNALQSQGRSSSVLGAIANPATVNPLADYSGAAQLAGNIVGLRQKQFDLQQAQLQPAYQAMRQVMATNDNPSWDDVTNALAQSARIGGNVDGLVANANETMSRGGKAGDFIRAYGMGGMSPWEQGQLAGPQRMSIDTGSGTYTGTTPGAWAPGAGTFQPGGFVAQGLSPGQATELITVQTPQGPVQVPRGSLFGGGMGVPGGGGGTAGGGGGTAGGGGGGGSGVALGMRQNNPGNLMFVGQPGAAPGQGNRFASFPDMPTGVAANAAQLIANQDQHGINTVAGQVNRWVSDPSANLGSYIADISSALGVKPNDPVNFHDPAVLQKYIQAMQPHESAGGGAKLDPTDVSAGVQMALSGGQGGGASRFPPGSYQVASNAPVAPPTGVQPASAPPTGRPGMQYLPAAPGMGGGGGGPQIPGVTYTPQGPIIRPTSPYEQPQLEQSAKDYVTDQVNNKSLSRRIAPLQGAMSIIKQNPGLVTGPSSDQWYQWVQGVAAATGIDVGDVHNANAYNELTKQLAMNLQGSGADPTDMARLIHEASQPNTAQGKQAIVTLAAEQIGYQRLKSAQYLEFRSRHPNDANNNAQFYNQETGDWASQQDPMAYAADLIPQAEMHAHTSSLNPAQASAFSASLNNARRLFNFKLPGQQ